MKKVYLFRGVSNGLLFQLVSKMRPKYFPTEVDVISQYEDSDDSYIVVTGAVDMIKNKRKKYQKVVGEVKIGEIFDDVDVLLDLPNFFTCRTKRPSQLLKLSHTAILNIVQDKLEDRTIMVNNFRQHLKETPGMRWISQEEVEEILIRKPPKKRRNPKDFVDKGLHIMASIGRDRDGILISDLDMGANPNKLDFHGDVPLWNAMVGGHESTIEILLDYGANLAHGDVGRFACTAAKENNLNLLKDITRYGGDVTRSDASGTTALHFAVSQGNVEIVKYLLKLGADVDMPDMLGLTPRAIATQLPRCADIKLIFYLIQKPNTQSSTSSYTERFTSLFSSCF